MTPEQLRALQAPHKDRYRNDPSSARATLAARGTLDVPNLICRIDSSHAPPIPAGLHPLAGGDDRVACAGVMLLEALVGCAGVTLCAVSTAIGLEVTSGVVTAEGDLDFRGTLGVSRETPVGYTAIRVKAVVETAADEAQLAKLAQLTERYCVVAQSLKGPLTLTIECPA